MSENNVVVRFSDVSFGYGHNRPILKEVSFSVRRGAKVALMGQNGAGKSTIFHLITKFLVPDSGGVHITGATIALARQVVGQDDANLSVREFFKNAFPRKIYDIDPKIDAVLEVVNLRAPHDRIIRSFSGGQQARLLLASALIQNPDILLLDEPTNNLDKEALDHLRRFLVEYKKTVIVISHDADFLNAFTEGVLYLDVFTKKVQQFAGNYFDVTATISAQIEKEERENARAEKIIQEKKDKANFFAHKGGKMRVLAKRMRDLAAEMEEAKVDVRKEDAPIRNFHIPVQRDIGGEILGISSLSVMSKGHKAVEKKTHISLRKNGRLLLSGPNGIGKTTLLESIASGKARGAKVAAGVEIGYYRQDFSNLDFESTVYGALKKAMKVPDEGILRSVAAGFLITKDLIGSKIGALSEGQKGLVAFAELVLMAPGLLILDEPTNHINFRHLPIIAKALDGYEGAMVLVSHVPEFVSRIRIDETLDLGRGSF
ncbi:MAG: ATP-binding cassette domain-containing protein [Nanoarchaeota archaeon]|nr:ATP-binding cassette domain-containing protein [Nanoarchaeota archaeon]